MVTFSLILGSDVLWGLMLPVPGLLLGVPARLLAASPLLHVPQKAGNAAWILTPPTLTWATELEFQAPDLSLAQLWPLWPLGELEQQMKTSRSLSLSLSHL